MYSDLDTQTVLGKSILQAQLFLANEMRSLRFQKCENRV